MMRIEHVGEQALPERGNRVYATVDNELLWFESSDIHLTPCYEAFASALLLPAAQQGQDLSCDASLDAQWVANTRKIAAVARKWWSVDVPRPESGSEQPLPASPHKHERVAQCFTGGIDSFFTLLETTPRPDFLVFALGYDIPLDDHTRFANYRRQLDQISEAFGAKAVVIRTNLRTHPSFRSSTWEWTHGGALAALGHLMSGSIDCLRVPPSYPFREQKPWGSHWELDYFWSSSSVSIEHADASLRRHEKMQMVSQSPVAMQTLRVCWENLSEAGNCGRCEKCIRTLIALAMHGALDTCATLDADEHRLVELIDGLPAVPPAVLAGYGDMKADLQELGPPSVFNAVSRLLDRSAPKNRPLIERSLRRPFGLLKKSWSGVLNPGR